MSLPSQRSEQVYVSRGVRRALEDMALMHLSTQPEGTEGPSIGAVADGLADQILRDYLDGVPRLAERRRKIRKFIEQMDAEDAQQQP